MKLTTLCTLFISFLFFACGQDAPKSNSQIKAVTTATELLRAKTGDEVWIIVSYIKNDKKSEFDMWIKDVLYAALYKSTNPMKKDQLKVTRWLEPIRQNEDKSWTYAWIMDPIIPNTDYDIPTFLNKEYGEVKGKEHWAKYESFWAKPVDVHVLKQTSL